MFKAAVSAKDLILNLYVNVPGKIKLKKENRDKLLLDTALHAFRHTLTRMQTRPAACHM